MKNLGKMLILRGDSATKNDPEASEALGSGVLQKHQVAVVRLYLHFIGVKWAQVLLGGSSHLVSGW